MDDRQLLTWLAREDFCAFGTCHGRALDALVLRDLVAINGTGAQARVTVTEKGLATLAAAHPLPAP